MCMFNYQLFILSNQRRKSHMLYKTGISEVHLNEKFTNTIIILTTFNDATFLEINNKKGAKDYKIVLKEIFNLFLNSKSTCFFCKLLIIVKQTCASDLSGKKGFVKKTSIFLSIHTSCLRTAITNGHNLSADNCLPSRVILG